jgi:hypothetical protein
MADDVQICNMALARISGQPISDIDSSTEKSAKYCRIFYEPVRDAVLAEFPWSFAVKRQTLALSTETNYTRYQYLYQLPTDPRCLRPLELYSASFEESCYPFKREGALLYTDEASPILKYIAQIDDPTLFDPVFVDAFAWLLAANLIKPLNGTPDQDPWTIYEQQILKASGIDARSSVEPPVASDRWTDRRF